LAAGRWRWFRRCFHDGECMNAIVCSFCPRSPHITAFESHEWLSEVRRTVRFNGVSTRAEETSVY
jgi:hypothetical protein